MSNMDESDRESDENSSSCSEEGNENENDRSDKISEYEKKRLSRISENKARMEALGLSKMASSLMSSSSSPGPGKSRRGKSKAGEEDEDYTPNCDDVEDRDDDDRQTDDDEECLGKGRSGYRKRKVKNKSSKSVQKAYSEKNHTSLDYDEEDDDLRKAIAISLGGSIGEGSNKTPSKRKSAAEEPRSGKKNKKSFASRLQMTEDELILYFYQFDEMGKGFISLRDLEKMATTHDFTWMDEELTDMIRCFDGDGDGKLSLGDFQKIVTRCHMLKEPDAP